MNFTTIRTSKFSRFLVIYLSFQLILTTFQPTNLWALTSGPSQPEFNSFTSIGTSDMVDLSSGDLNYNIPVLDVGGYPLNLSYSSGITMDQEASWVGLGWNLNVGHIDRNVRGIPDDFNGDMMDYSNYFKPNTTVGASFNVSAGFFGAEVLPIKPNLSVGLTALYNNYEGVSFVAQKGLGFTINENLNVSANFSSSITEGASVSPSLSLGPKIRDIETTNYSGGASLTYNSREGLKNFGLQSTISPAGASSTSTGLSWSFNDPTYTPTKRVGLNNSTFSYHASAGGTLWGVDFQGRIEGFGTIQEIPLEEQEKSLPAFGYENTEYGEGKNGILDFNRSKDGTFNKNTTAVPVTNYTYDLYTINAQGLSASFRPFRSQVGYVYDPEVQDDGSGVSLGGRFGGGAYVYVGAEKEIHTSTSRTGKWVEKNNALGKFIERPNEANSLSYEPTYFKIINEITRDSEESFLFEQQLHGEKPMNLKIGETKYARTLAPAFRVGSFDVNIPEENIPLMPIANNNFKRTKRLLRSQNVYKVSQEEAVWDPFVDEGSAGFTKPHHTVGIKVIKTDGSQYVFGKSLYNTTKIEATFDVSGKNNIADCSTGIIELGGKTGHHSEGSDRYQNKITTPAYSHSYLLSSVLSSDYEDVDGNGPSLNDLGNYTWFKYKTYNTGSNPYKWRLPYSENEFYYNEGLKTEEHDEKASYIYGTKELTYINTIETKTHVAYFELDNREDARGARGEFVNSLPSTPAYSKKIKRIYLFSRPEYESFRSVLEDANNANNPSFEVLAERATKIVHFEYDYSLVPGIPNNLSGGGKLTLKKLYFTYRNSNMGKYMPYNFNYDNLNPYYHPKAYDVWGNFKPYTEGLVQTDENGNVVIGTPSVQLCDIQASLTNQEYPYPLQIDRDLQDKFSSAWTLSSINLPSGGRLELKYESDDYRFVQDKKAMRMFNVIGAGDEALPLDPYQRKLYNGKAHKKYLYVKIKEETLEGTAIAALKNSFNRDYLNNDLKAPIQFNFLLNMVKNSLDKYDYVNGYFELDDQEVEVFSNGEGTYASIPLKFLENEGGLISSTYEVNPIAKAGWYFGRTNLNREVYSLGGSGYNGDTSSIIQDLMGSLGGIFEVFAGPNTKLQEKNCARDFIPAKSWIRLYSPETKVGGGIRVKEMRMYDQWDIMTGNTGDNLYSQLYGQQYTYENEQGHSSGVATFEPQISRENPFIQPFYSDPTTGRDKLVAPAEFNYTEKPFGEAFFPFARISYSRVRVENLKRIKQDASGTVVSSLKKHGTGFINHEFYTTRDFPTQVSYTPMDKAYDNNEKSFGVGLSQILNFNITAKQHLTLSQGFSIITNDMDSKPKAQYVYAEGMNTPVSSIKYNYNIDQNGGIETHLPVIESEGKVNSQNSLGMYYDVTNDFRETTSTMDISGRSMNLTGIPALFGVPFPMPLILPKFFKQETILRTATTTKIIHKSGILMEKVVSDLGSEVFTKNVAWDPTTGNELLVKTNNEFNDFYYNLRFPSYWAYENMGLASQNLGVKGILTPLSGGFFKINGESGSITDILIEGDELLVDNVLEENINEQKKRYWVLSHNTSGSGVRLIDSKGSIIDPCGDEGKSYNFKIVRSGFRNLPQSTMASVTSILNPIDPNQDEVFDNLQMSTFKFINASDSDPKVLSASAIEYKDFWKPQRESGIPLFPEDVNEKGDFLPGFHYEVNPYLYNIKGDWKPYRSYAYLTSRQDKETVSNRHEGFYSDFLPFYALENGEWVITGLSTNSKWAFASEVTKQSPYGAEVENKDALGRFSAAQYGYNYTLPIAVAANSSYKEMAFDGFEDYSFSNENGHFSFQEQVRNNISVSRSSEKSHTGKYSIKVAGNNKAAFSSKLLEENVASLEIDCLTDPAPTIGSLIPKCRYNNCNDNALCSVLFEVNYTNLDPSGIYTYRLNQTPSFATVSLETLYHSGSTATQNLIYTEEGGYGSVQFTIELYDNGQRVASSVYTLSHSSYMPQLSICPIQ